MYICIRLKIINLNESKLVYNPNDNLHDLFSQYGDDRIPVDKLKPTYYLSNNNDVFSLMDAFEERIPCFGHEVCWDWTGVRKGGKYYLIMDVMALLEETARFWEVFKALFIDFQVLNTSFVLPEIDSPMNLDDPDSFDNDNDYEECDEESLLRRFEKETIGNPDIQWKREPKEYGGSAGTIVLLGTAVGVVTLGHAFLKGFVNTCMKKHYAREIDKLLDTVCVACEGEGIIIRPEPVAPKAWNDEVGEYQYEFTQILSDGSKNKVFIGTKAGKPTIVPYYKSKKDQ